MKQWIISTLLCAAAGVQAADEATLTATIARLDGEMFTAWQRQMRRHRRIHHHLAPARQRMANHRALSYGHRPNQ